MKYSEAKQYLKEGMKIKITLTIRYYNLFVNKIYTIQYISNAWRFEYEKGLFSYLKDYEFDILTNPDGTNWLASTETYADTGTSGNILALNGTKCTTAAPILSTTTFLNTATSGKILVGDGTKWVNPNELKGIKALVRVRTQEQWNELVGKLIGVGIKWCDGSNNIESEKWNYYKEQSCIWVHDVLSYGSYSFWEENKSYYQFTTIYEFDEFMEKYFGEEKKISKEMLLRLQNTVSQSLAKISSNLINGTASISSVPKKEKTLMRKLSELNATIRRTFNADKKTLWQVGYIDDCGQWTSKAKEEAVQALAVKWCEDNAAELIANAKEELEVEKS